MINIFLIIFKINKMLHLTNQQIIYSYNLFKNNSFIRIYEFKLIIFNKIKIYNKKKYLYLLNRYIIEYIFLYIIKNIINILNNYDCLSFFHLYNKKISLFILYKKTYLIIYFKIKYFCFIKLKIIKKIEKDLLTGFINKMTFIKYSNFIFNRFFNIMYSSFIIFDIDNFKKYNNAGHLKGDIILKKFSFFLKKILYKNIFISRFGGEEFIIYIIKKSLIEIFKISEIIRISINNTKFKKNKNLYNNFTVSFGINNHLLIYLTKNYKNLKLINKSDIALNCAKKLGRNKVKILL